MLVVAAPAEGERHDPRLRGVDLLVVHDDGLPAGCEAPDKADLVLLSSRPRSGLSRLESRAVGETETEADPALAGRKRAPRVCGLEVYLVAGVAALPRLERGGRAPGRERGHCERVNGLERRRKGELGEGGKGGRE